MSKNLKKILLAGASLLMLASVGVSANDVNVNASHVRTHRIKKHSKRALHNYHHKKNIHKYNLYKMHHRRHSVSKAKAYQEGKRMSYEASINGEESDGGNYAVTPSTLKRLGITKKAMDSYSNGIMNETNYIGRSRKGSYLFGKNIHRPFKQRIYQHIDGVNWLQGIIFGTHRNKATKNTIKNYLKDEEYNTKFNSKLLHQFDKNYKITFNHKQKDTKPIKLENIINNRHNKKATAIALMKDPQ